MFKRYRMFINNLVLCKFSIFSILFTAILSFDPISVKLKLSSHRLWRLKNFLFKTRLVYTFVLR